MKVIWILFLSGGVFCKQQSDDILELITQAGFEGEAHNVQTEDGYILRLHRILPRGKPVSKLPVFLMHGMLVYSSTFLMSAPENSFGYLLADAGFDVWMGNTRGTKFSMNHSSLSIESSEFWEFSFHEMGFYDLPAMIDFMLQKTNTKKFFCFGHSQGFLAILVLLSMRPEYNKKIEQVHLTASFTHNITHEIFGTFSYLNLSPGWELLQKLFCSEPRGSFELVAAGSNKHKIQMDKRVTRKYLNYLSPRLAVMQFAHYVQIYTAENSKALITPGKTLRKKNSRNQPNRYNLLKITSPTFLYAGNVDALVSDQDTATLAGLLPNVKNYQIVDDWNHYDFVLSKDARLYKKIIKYLKSGV